MAGDPSWGAGAGVGLTYATLINSADLASMANLSTVLSSVADIANGTALDKFMDISFSLAIASSTIAAGANFAFWIYDLNQDATTYGDGQFTAGTAAAKTPSIPPVATFWIPAVAATTTMVGTCRGIILPPGSFRVAMQNNCGFAFTAGTQTVKYRTYV